MNNLLRGADTGVETATARNMTSDLLAKTLTDKIAMMLIYCEDLRSRVRPRDTAAFNSLLDDPEVAAWITKMRYSGRGRNTRFTGTN